MTKGLIPIRLPGERLLKIDILTLTMLMEPVHLTDEKSNGQISLDVSGSENKTSSVGQSLEEQEGNCLLSNDLKVPEEKDLLILFPSTATASTPYLLFFKKL